MTRNIALIVDRGISWEGALKRLEDNKMPGDGFYKSKREMYSRHMYVLALRKGGAGDKYLICRPNTGISFFEEDREFLTTKYERVTPEEAQEGSVRTRCVCVRARNTKVHCRALPRAAPNFAHHLPYPDCYRRTPVVAQLLLFAALTRQNPNGRCVALFVRLTPVRGVWGCVCVYVCVRASVRARERLCISCCTKGQFPAELHSTAGAAKRLVPLADSLDVWVQCRTDTIIRDHRAMWHPPPSPGRTFPPFTRRALDRSGGS